MLTMLVFLFLAVIALGALSTPFFAPLGMLLLLFGLAGAVWWIGLLAITRGHPSEAVLRTPRRRFLGPGGPDDPFADVPYPDEAEWQMNVTPTEEDEMSTTAATASISEREKLEIAAANTSGKTPVVF